VPSATAGVLVRRSDAVCGRTRPVGALAGEDSAEPGAGMAGTGPVGLLVGLPENDGAPIGTRPVGGLTVPVVRLSGSTGGCTEPVEGRPGGSAPVAGRAAAAGGGSGCDEGFREAVGTRSELDGAGSGVVPGRDGVSPVERRSMAVAGRTGPVGDFAGVGETGARVELAGGRMEPEAGRVVPLGGKDVVGGLSEPVAGRVEPVAGGGLRVSRMEPVAGRLDGRGGACDEVAGGAGLPSAGGGNAPERGMSGTVVEGWSGEAGRGVEGGTSSGMAAKKGIRNDFRRRRSCRRRW
jgi:hypothetical protein